MYEQELQFAIKTAKEASEIVRKIYFDNSAIVQIKSDDSPVTQADLLSEKLIRERIGEAYPTYGILSEETEDNLERLKLFCSSIRRLASFFPLSVTLSSMLFEIEEE